MGTTWAIIPCGGEKANHPAPAADLYTSSTFRMQLRAALEITDPGHVLVLSALHGLVALDDEIAPYDLRMGQPGSVDPDTIATQALAHGIDWGSDVYALLPTAYFERLDSGLRLLDVYAAPVYEATAGIGDQRRVCNLVAA